MRLKTVPEEFVVDEVLDYLPRIDEQGGYSLYLLKKRLWNTEDCVEWLAKGLHKDRKDFAVCGNKDKHAITSQYLTVKAGPKDLHGYDGGEGKRFSVEYLGRVKQPLRLGAHRTNRFTIVIRELDAAGEGTTPALKPIVNYFGQQRFSAQNDTVGMHLIRKEYEAAAEALGLPISTDPISAIRTLPKHTRILYVHAAQSKLWNELAATIVKETPSPTASNNPLVPVPGFGPEGDAQYLPAMDALLEKNGLDRMSFVNRSMQELSVEGGARKLYQEVEEFAATPITDGCCTVTFTLGTGQYATETVRQLFEN